MDLLEKKSLDTSRGLRYTYYISPPSTADTSKPVLLLCHGWPDSASLWQYILPHLIHTKCRILAPDLLGAGGTSKPTDPAVFEIRAMVQDVDEILDAEGLSKQQVIPIGHDWGAYYAQRFYNINKDRMAGVVTLNVAWMTPATEPFNLEQFNAFTTQAVGYPVYSYWELFADPKVGEVMDHRLDSLWVAMHGEPEDWMKQLFCVPGAARSFISAGRTDVPLRAYAKDEKLKADWIAEKKASGMTSQCAWYRALKEDHQLETERTLDATVSTPYLFVGCTGDAVCRTDFIEVGKQAGLVKEKNLEVHEIKSGHWCPYEKPDEVGSILVQWLKKNGFSS